MFAWHDVATGTTAHFRGLAALSANKAWVSRLHRDRRRRLPHARPRRDLAGRQPGGHSLDAPVPRHRGVRRQPRGRHVVGNRPGLADYRTADGGQTWTLVFQNTEPNAFYDCMTFFNRKVGLASPIRRTD